MQFAVVEIAISMLVHILEQFLANRRVLPGVLFDQKCQRAIQTVAVALDLHQLEVVPRVFQLFTYIKHNKMKGAAKVNDMCCPYILVHPFGLFACE